MSKADETRKRLLEAAQHVVLRDGVARLTLDLVAVDAGVSKGAVLYHFPTKNALIGALIELHMLDMVARHAAAYAQDEPTPGRWLRAFIRSCPREKQPNGNDGRGPHGAGMLAALANDPELLGAMRQRVEQWQASALSDGIDPATATVVRLALDGLAFTDLLGMAPITGELRQQVLERLLALSTIPTPLETNGERVE